MNKETNLILRCLQKLLCDKDGSCTGKDRILLNFEIEDMINPSNNEDKTGEKFIKDIMDVGDEPKK